MLRIREAIAVEGRYDKNTLSQLHEPVTNLALETNVADFAVAFIVGTGTVAIERIAIGIGVVNGEDNGEVDLVLQTHFILLPDYFLLVCCLFLSWYRDPPSGHDSPTGILR